MSKDNYWVFDGAVMLKPWARPVWPVHGLELALLGVCLCLLGIKAYDLLAYGDLALLVFLPVPLALGHDLDKPWIYPHGCSSHLSALLLFSLIYTALFPWYVLGYLAERYVDKQAIDAHYFKMHGADAWWHVLGMSLPKPWRRPNQKIIAREQALAAIWFVVAVAEIILVLITNMILIYEFATGRVDILLLEAAWVYAAIFVVSFGIWKSMLREQYLHASSGLERREKIPIFAACWISLAFIYTPYHIMTWGRWLHKWKTD
jgi:hypothetical protein